jgi:putative membrane protein
VTFRAATRDNELQHNAVPKESILMMWGYGNMGWAWGYGLLVLAGVAVLIYVVVRLVANKSESADARSAPKQADSSGAKRILEERFARGELTAEQYREQRRVLDESQ